ARCGGDELLLRALAEAGQFSRAEKLLKTCYTTNDELGAYLAACVLAGEHKRAVKSINSRNRKGKDVAYGVVEQVARACVMTETCRPTFEVIDSIESDGHRDYAKFVAGEQLVEQGQIERALELLTSLSNYRQKLVGKIFARLTRDGELGRASKLAESFEDPARRTAIEAVAGELADAGDEELARKWADEVSYSGRYQFWLRLAEGLLERGEHQRAWECLKLIRERPSDEWKSEPVPWQVDRDLMRAAKAHTVARRFERALFFLAHVEQGEDKVREIRHLAHDVGTRDEPARQTEPELLRLVADRLRE
ncbi:MAG: hypothetical protein JRF63_12265, partial [Deltaproteobacteria bacterium]|nr:hypothetical protein [Deltaproteobacteria bacterium]